MATKTFKTRIKLKYDSASNWLPNGAKFQGLAGELLIGSDDNYLRIGTGDIRGWEYAKMSADNVNITSYTSGNTEIDTAQAAIADLNSRINTITDGMVTSFGEKTGAITLNSDSGLSISDNNVLTIAKANGSQLGVVKVTTGNGLAITNGVISMNVANASAAGAVKVNANNGLSLADDGTITMGLASGTTAGAMSKEDFTKLLGIEAGAEVNDIVAVQVNGADLTPDSDRTVNITIAEGTENGKITVNGTGVAVHGLKSAAYTEASAYQASFEDGSATVANLDSTILTLKNVSQTGGKIGEGSATTLTFASEPTDTNKIVTQSDISGIVGAMVYQGTLGEGGTVTTLPQAAAGNKGYVYVVSVDGTYNGNESAQVGDMYVSNGDSWDLIQGNVNVQDKNATIEVGADNATAIAIVEGKTIHASVTASADKVTYGENSNVNAALDSLNTAVTTTLPASIGAISDNAITGDGAIIIPANTTVGSDTISITHVKPGATTAAAVMVGKDEFGHVVTGAALTASNIKYEGDTTIKAAIDLKANSSDLTGLANRVSATEGAITTLNGGENTEGSVKNTVATTITSALNDLDGSTTIETNATTGAKTITSVKQINGEISNGDQAVTIGKAGQTNQIYDLDENDAENFIIFDCGTSAGWPTPNA